MGSGAKPWHWVGKIAGAAKRPRDGKSLWVNLVLAALCGGYASAGEVKENYDDGKLKIRYHTDEKDHRVGVYDEFFPNGKLKVHGQYAMGKKSGQWNTSSEDGKLIESATYRNDLLEGPYAWHNVANKAGMRVNYRAGELAGAVTVLDDRGQTLYHLSYPRTRDAVEKAFNTLYQTERPKMTFLNEPQWSPPYKAGALPQPYLEAALNMTKLYRYLSGVPWQDLKIDATMCDTAAHGAVVLAKIGSLTHTPARPGDMDAGFFDLAYRGCHESNLSQGVYNPASAVMGFMDDSDGTNSNLVGHRQWALAPTTHAIGFGGAGQFIAMYVFDGTRQGRLDYNFIAYPGEGFYPRALIPGQAAWSIHLNNAKAKVGSADTLKINLQKLDDHYQPAGEPIASKIVAVPSSISPTFGWTVVIFKPELTELEPARYWVQVTGVKTTAGADTPFGYLVDFIDVSAAQTASDVQKGRKPAE